MREPRSRPPDAARALQMASRARARAVRAAEVASRHEDLAAREDSPLRELHVDMAALHRTIESRQLAAARMQNDHALRVEAWAVNRTSSVPRFVTAVAAEVGAEHVGISLVLGDRTQAVAVATSPVAQAVQDAEYALGEGPVHDVTSSGAPVVVDAAALAPRWPRFAGRVARLGVGAVVAVPLRTNTACLGALAVFDPPAERSRSTAVLCTVADALVQTELLVPGRGGPLDIPLLAGGEYHALVHQAGGMLAEQLGCDVADALVMLRARAFTNDEPLDTTAAAVVDGRLGLD